MVKFLSIFFFLDFFNICWDFQKFPFFCVTLYKCFRTYQTLRRWEVFETYFWGERDGQLFWLTGHVTSLGKFKPAASYP
jgi:hypothetical protein